MDTPSSSNATTAGTRARHALAFFAIAVAWIAIDQAAKRYFESAQELGAVVPGLNFGIVQFRLVHNTGAAWSLFSDMTWLLGVVSLVVCAGMLVYALFWVKRPNWVLTCGAALVFAGGIGNAIDRFSQGYVVDFIEATFIDFPVFNVADIGVTCGFVLALIGAYRYLAWRDHEAERVAAQAAEEERKQAEQRAANRLARQKSGKGGGRA